MMDSRRKIFIKVVLTQLRNLKMTQIDEDLYGFPPPHLNLHFTNQGNVASLN